MQTEPRVGAQLRGRVALVTGASRGLGRATAIALARRGVGVGLTARSRPELEAVAAEIQAAGGRAAVARADLTVASEVEAALAVIVDRLGGVDILINNAATLGPVGPFVAIDADAWAVSIEVNLLAPVRLARALLPRMLTTGWGRIVAVSSGGVSVPAFNRGLNAYISAKSALEGHILNLAGELAGSGVTANVLRPGLVDTAMQAWVRDQPAETIGAQLHAQFVAWHREGILEAPERPAARLVALVAGDTNGEIVDYHPHRKHG